MRQKMNVRPDDNQQHLWNQLYPIPAKYILFFYDGRLGYDTVGNGWVPIVRSMLHDMQATTENTVYIRQIKEKFGTLRVYWYTDSSDGKPLIDGIVRNAEKISGETCEGCGDPGELRNDQGWKQTLCDSCWAHGP